MPGLIQNNMGQPTIGALPDDPKATAGASATTYDPAQRTVDKNQTVSGQLGDILAEDSPYVEAAKNNALQTANERGIVNSTIAAGAGTKAAIESSLPIAQQDASTFGQAASQNMDAKNTALNQGAALSTQVSQGNANNTTQQIEQQTAGTQASTLSAQQATQASGLSAQQSQQQQALVAEQGDISKQLQDLQAKSASGLSAQESQQQSDLLARKGEIDKQLQELTASEQSSLSAQQAGQAQTLTQLQGTIDKQLQELRGTQAEGIANIQGQYQQLIQSNASAAQFFSNMVKNVSDILNNQYTSADQKQSAIDKQTQLLKSGLAVIGGISNLDLTGLLDFSKTGLNAPLTNTPPPAAPPAEPPPNENNGTGA